MLPVKFGWTQSSNNASELADCKAAWSLEMLYFSRWTTHPTQWLINSVSLMDGKAEKEWRCHRIIRHKFLDQIIELIWISRSSEHSKYSSWHVIPSSTHRWCVSSMNVWLISTWLRLIYNYLINWTDIIIPHTVINDIITCIGTIAWIPSYNNIEIFKRN